MRNLRKRLGTAGAVTGILALAAALSPPTAAQAAASAHNCDSGYVCLYPSAAWGTPSYTYYDYGCYKLYGQYNRHRLFNNQFADAGVETYKSGDCTTGAVEFLGAGAWDDPDLTPINSIELFPR